MTEAHMVVEIDARFIRAAMAQSTYHALDSIQGHTVGTIYMTDTSYTTHNKNQML